MTLLGASVFASFPWLLAASFCFALAAATPPRRREVWALALLTVATFVGRSALVPALFFHQNGQGPHLVERAFHGVFHEYGPGLFELFHGVAALRPRDPESAIFFVQSLLAAPGPACAWHIARRVGARPPLAGAIALVVALDPMLARLARSESYFGTGASLILLAMACLSLRATNAPPQSGLFLWASLAAGALIAQVARLHPLLWPAASLTPLVLLAGQGALRRRVRATLAASFVMAAMVLVLAGPSMWGALHSDLAHRFSSRVGFSVEGRAPPSFLEPLVGLGLVVLLSRRPVRALPRVALALGVGAVVYLGNFPAASELKPWIEGGYLRVYTGAFVIVVAALLRDIPRTRAHEWVVAWVGALVFVVPIAMRYRDDRVVPTDTQEAQLARSWRALLPPGATLFWLAQAEQGTLRLPIYPDADIDLRRARPLDVLRLARLPHERRDHDVWYYRSSLCSTPPGLTACEDFERNMPLRLVRAWTLPAVESYSLPYVRRPVRVALYRVEPPTGR